MRPWRVLVIGPTVFLALYIFGILTGLRLDFKRDLMIQFIGRQELASANWGDLLWIHSQPPGFNALLKITDSFSDGGVLALRFILLACTLLGILMAADLAWQLSNSRGATLFVGLLCAIVPGTLYYTLWVFYTIPVAMLWTAAIWGAVLGSLRRKLPPLALSAVAMVLLFLLRGTFAWPVVALWFIVLAIVARKCWTQSPLTTQVACTSLFIAIVGVVLAVQVSAYERFGSLSLSSWSYENAAKALMTQMPEPTRQRVAGEDRCLRDLVTTGVFRPVSEYPSCALTPLTSREGLPALITHESWQNGTTNLNNEKRVALSGYWKEYVIDSMRSNPLALVRIPFPNFEVKERGTLYRFLAPNSWYWVIEENVVKGGKFASLWIIAFSWVPLVMIGGVILGLIGMRRRWYDEKARVSAYTIAATATLALCVAYLYLETGENDRFRMETDWILISLGSVGWWIFLTSRKRRVKIDKGENE